MLPDPQFWQGRRVLVTGHTGFKGSWLCLWLQSMGARVHGLALAPPTDPALFEQARIAQGMVSTLADVRDAAAVLHTMRQAQPEIIIHMAAQPLVRASYAEPVATYATNVMGTVHVLDAARQVGGVRAIVNVTTDKCYENVERLQGYREDEPMGGHDPYSNSKGCSELVTSAYRKSFFAQGSTAVASARAGNVIGGGDWAQDRLIPDFLRAMGRGEPLVIRHPQAIRPWQHVLEPLSGYLLLAQRLVEQGQPWAQAWNFGPLDADARPVQWLVEQLVAQWGNSARWQCDAGEHLHEAHYLKLDITKAQQQLGWQPRWDLATALHKIIAWQQAWLAGGDARALCLQHINDYQVTV
jgi:CDP-glucose 4,6-dehydratase